MTRFILTTLGAATLFASAAVAAPRDDIPTAPEPPADEVCDSADFANQGQWVKCLTHNGVHGKELARRIHDEHQARKGGETTERSKAKSKQMAKRADGKARKAKAKSKAKQKAKDRAGKGARRA